ncbi:amidohydrolase 2 [Artomyces pyxidatus]|uniref:Amidohydrolase 2 n=1 Tax=Artomyces pyxidatus TaxID=48021 RepID=A0ACB8TJA1_9AGAM|nr:amidohydrolase 2 [Artomyces pyxidatus]
MAALQKLLVDVHTHVYLPRYASLLRARLNAPRILTRSTPSGQTEDRLLILDDEPSGGRPVGAQYWDREEKLKFMDKHGISVSFVSTANPWLDFLPFSDAQVLAQELNADLETYCSTSPSLSPTLKRLYGFGLLPLVPGAPASALAPAVSQLASNHPHIRGIILGTRGAGAGLDDPALEPLWGALAETGLVVFLHPHYGVGAPAWGARENGHVLPLALGFPFETTIAITRLILAGVLDRHPNLRILLAHSGGALPQLSSRLASCITHDPEVAGRLKHDARWYLGRLWFDAVAYGAAELGFVSEAVGRAERYASVSGKAVGEQEARRSGSQRMVFGTDHPFFPPLGESEKWQSVVENLEAIGEVEAWSEEDKDGVRGGNAMRLFGLQ